ncbi:MAG: valine--tRNA ligase [Anaerolineae bacterium]|nr:valine--tRNA ligase [Anaerolineae bacterium]NUQ02753.1 valine--tRNA ligase [Anaerolineae bacterium]
MSTKQMPKNFDFKEAETRLYAFWEQRGYFKPEAAPSDAEPYVISMPPPNVTGALHIGHALFVTLEDLMIRYERMRGKAALWVPGTDHASIATQLQVEKLLADEGLTREQVGREKFLERAWEWKEKYGGTIVRQLRRLGASCDWERERFTMDAGFSDAVLEVFIRLYEQGLIYKGPRLVNWSPGLKTAVSDLEVEREEEMGKLYFFRYPVEGGGFIPVATTRPETILGDTAVAVHPEDDRYRQYIGKNALVPMLNRPIPIIADPYVDREFGTGALKVTPGHDFNDYQIAQRHNLAMISIMNRDATLNEHAGLYAGMDRFDCREKLWADMTAAGLTIEVKEHLMVVPRTQRGGEVVEPMISEQWFVKIKPLADRATAAVRDGRIRIVPDRFEKVYFHWLENLDDWCISRQLWWGHRIPVWYGSDGSRYVGKTAPEPRDGVTWMPDDDVLDTWFSSGLWPFGTLGWPQSTPDLSRYYPTDVLETGYDILFFWVARMIMLGLWFTDEPPFHTVYLHGLVRDRLGRKISKTLGNVIDPLELMEQYGTDPLRLALVTGSTPGNDINLDTARVERNWRFVNKIWQMTNFVSQNLGDDIAPDLPPHDALDLPARWIISRLNHLIATVQRLFDAYQYGEAGRQIDDFLWSEFADWYIEISKYPLYQGDAAAKHAAQQVLLRVLDRSLRLLHPYMPFVTEDLWQYLPHAQGQSEALILAEWPQADAAYFDDAAEAEMTLLIDLVRGIRNVREQYNVEPSRKITAIIQPGSHHAAIESCGYMFARLCNVAEYRFTAPGEPAPSNTASVVAGDVIVYLPLTDFIDISAECERLTRELQKIDEQAGKAQATLSNDQFVSRARPDVVERERARLESLHASAAQIRERIADLCG